MMTRRLKLILGIGSACVLTMLLTCIKVQAPLTNEAVGLFTDEFYAYDFPYSIEKDATLTSELLAQGFSIKDAKDIFTLSRPYYNFAVLPMGMKYRLINANSPIISRGGIEFRLSSTRTLKFVKDNFDQWQVHHREDKVQTRVVSFVGTVRSSLWESARSANMAPGLISQLTDIFGWELDFSRQVSENDSWRLTVEQNTVKGKTIGWGRILAAEYVNNGKTYSAVYYEQPGQISGYFDTEGRSLSKTFLRSPIEFARITSGFSLRRFHPKLKIYRPHLGVDYAAPTGTPIRALGDGLVLEARYTAGGGKTISLGHGGSFKTRYLHMSAFAARIRTGTSVKQGQIIGYVGTTGLSTGPHLHFEFYKNNHYMDPLKVELPANNHIPATLYADFKAQTTQLLNQLPPLPQSVAMYRF